MPTTATPTASSTFADYSCDVRVTDSNGPARSIGATFASLPTYPTMTGNGYIDDLSGWDADDDDGDEFDHATSATARGAPESSDPKPITAAASPACAPTVPLMNVRIGRHIRVQQRGSGEGCALCHRQRGTGDQYVVGCTTASRLSRGAFDYATRKNVLAVNASANEFSFHQISSSVFDDVMTIGAVTPNRRCSRRRAAEGDFANYGAHSTSLPRRWFPGADMSSPRRAQ